MVTIYAPILTEPCKGAPKIVLVIIKAPKVQEEREPLQEANDRNPKRPGLDTLKSLRTLALSMHLSGLGFRA